MLVLITYDVSTMSKAGVKRLNNIAKTCLDYGQRVQNSVFECLVSPAQWAVLRKKLTMLYNSKEDSLRFYFLGKNWERRVEHHGIKNTFNLETDTLMI